MREKIDCFLPCNDVAEIADSIQTLSQSKTTQHINLLVSDTSDICTCSDTDSISNCTVITIDGLTSTKTILTIEEHTDAEYVLLSLKHTPVNLGLHALERLLRVATDSNAGMVYADSYIQKDGVQEKHPTIDYQTGSIRDDFDFGQLVLIRASLLHEYAAKQQLTDYKWAGFYDLRLYISRKAQIFHLNEYLYTQVETDSRKSGERQFDYVNPRNREVQIEDGTGCHKAPGQDWCYGRHIEVHQARLQRAGLHVRGIGHHTRVQPRENHRRRSQFGSHAEDHIQI